MRILDMSAVTGGVGFPPKKGVFQFLQDAYTDIVNKALITTTGVIFNNTDAYVLYGCVATVAGPNTNFTEGAIYFDGEIFPVDAQSIVTPAGPAVILVNITTTQDAADPIILTNLTPANMLNIRKATFAAGTTGTGDIADFSDLILNTGWVNASFNTGWSNFDPANPVKYRRLGNIVNLRGLALSSTSTSSLMLTLPASYSPALDFQKAIYFTDGLTTSGIAILNIKSTGDVVVFAANGFPEPTTVPNSTTYSLGDISFYID